MSENREQESVELQGAHLKAIRAAINSCEFVVAGVDAKIPEDGQFPGSFETTEIDMKPHEKELLAYLLEAFRQIPDGELPEDSEKLYHWDFDVVRDVEDELTAKD